MASRGPGGNAMFLSIFVGWVAVFTLIGVSATRAQDKPKTVIEGYVTALYPPDEFAVNGIDRVTTTYATTYQWFGNKETEGKPASKDNAGVGAFVQVSGAKNGKAVSATLIAVRDLEDKTIKGFGIIDKVIAAGAEPVFRADGYRIRIPSGAAVKFSGPLKTLADVGTNDWVQYEGKLDKAGDLVAASAAFSPGKTGTKKPGQLAKDAAIPDTIPPGASIIDANGNFKGKHAKVRYGDSGGLCGWHRLSEDPALQLRVRRVGLSLIPAYQNELAASEAEKIHFRFYAVEETVIRSEVVCNSGLILMPRQMAIRLKSDDELAAILADGIAFYLQAQSQVLKAEGWELTSVYLAGLAAEKFVPGIDIAAAVGVDVAAYRINMLLEQQRGRMALALMEDAGYDPWAAPEAWRLLAPKNLPKDLDSLKYPNRSGYQLAVLNQQYRKSGAASAAAPTE